MILNLPYDSSVAGAPVGFTAVLSSIVSFFQTNFKDPVTVNIAVGYGEVNGQALSQGELGKGHSPFADYDGQITEGTRATMPRRPSRSFSAAVRSL